MTLRLSEFNLKTYKEREILLIALTHAKGDKFYAARFSRELTDLITRLADTQCQPGGCEYCSNVEGD